MIYLDNNATTIIDSKVYIKLCETMKNSYGNPSSLYPLGVNSHNIISKARKQVAHFINADLESGDKIVFTSCASESNNSIFHSVLINNHAPKQIIVSDVEHPSILNTAAFYEKLGYTVTRVGTDVNGILDEEELLSHINRDTVLVSMMLVNSETGVINDIGKLCRLIKQKNDKIIVHTDAVQAAGKMIIDVKSLGVDFLTLSGHKFHAPKGIGTLYIKKDVSYHPFILGGHQESNLRAGTENVGLIAAIGEAAEIADGLLRSGKEKQIEQLRDYLEFRLNEMFQDIYIMGKNAPRVCNTSNVGFKNINGASLVLKLASNDICISSGTACNSLSAEPSHVLQVMKTPNEYIRSIRLSLSKYSTTSEIDVFLKVLKTYIKQKG